MANLSRNRARRQGAKAGPKRRGPAAVETTVPVPRGSLLAGWRRRLAAPVDIASVAVFRIAFGLLMLWHVLQYLAGGRLERQYLTPLFYFKFTGFEWVKVGSPAAMVALFSALAVAALLVALGLFYRWACAAFLCGFLYVFLLDEADYQNHLYLIALLAGLLILVPAHRALSLDAWRKPALRSRTIPTWTLWILRFQLAVPYTIGGINKLSYDWLARAEPMTTWLREGTEGGLRLAALRSSWAPWALSWGGAAFDLLVVPALLWRRTRLAAVAATLFFHLANSELFTIGIFPWLMLAATSLFFPPDWPRRAGLLVRRERPLRVASPQAPSPLPAAVAGLLALWVAVQLLVPFRHLLYPGDVNWTEEGGQFSWRMKLRDKRGELRFVAVDPPSGRQSPLEGLDAAITKAQYRMMQHDPDMIRQFAAYLAERLAAAGIGRVEVRAVSSISLNGRPEQPLVDPQVDLATLPASWRHASWIVPLRPLTAP